LVWLKGSGNGWVGPENPVKSGKGIGRSWGKPKEEGKPSGYNGKNYFGGGAGGRYYSFEKKRSTQQKKGKRVRDFKNWGTLKIGRKKTGTRGGGGLPARGRR